MLCTEDALDSSTSGKQGRVTSDVDARDGSCQTQAARPIHILRNDMEVQGFDPVEVLNVKGWNSQVHE